MRVLIDDQIDDAISSRLTQALDHLEVRCDAWDGRPVQPGSDADAFVTEILHARDDLETKIASTRGLRTVALVDRPSHAVTRWALKIGASGVVDIDSRTISWAHAVVAAAAGLDVVPDGHAATMASRTTEPPRELSEEERRFLRLATTLSIEAVGIEIGMSRRQSQRYMSKLCGDLGLRNHFEAATNAGRWGLLD